MKFPIYKKQVKSSRRSFIKYDKKSYYRNVYLRSNHWQNLKSEKFEHNDICEKCGINISLDVHHKKYRNLYDVKLSDLQVLCRKCHEKIHKKQEENKRKKKNKFNRKRDFRRGLRYSDICREFKWSKNPLIRYYIILFLIIKIFYVINNHRYSLNVKKSINWKKINIELKTNFYARSKIYNEYFKNLL